MLTIHYRTTESVPLYETMESYIVKYHGPDQFNAVKGYIKEIHDIREEIVRLTSYDDPILLEKYNAMLIDYYVGMKFLGDKFKFSDDDDGISIAFTWKDSLTGE